MRKAETDGHSEVGRTRSWEPKWIVCACLFVLVFWAVTPLLARAMKSIYGIGDTENLGQIGDVFGIANAFFSAIAFIVIAATLLLQWRHLVDQQKGASETRSIAVEQVRQLAMQAAADRKAIYFQSITTIMRDFRSLLSEVVVNDKAVLSLKDPSDPVISTEMAIQMLWEYLEQHIVPSQFRGDPTKELRATDTVSEYFVNMYDAAPHLHDRYLRQLNVALDIIDNQAAHDLPEAETASLRLIIGLYLSEEELAYLLALARSTRLVHGLRDRIFQLYRHGGIIFHDELRLLLAQHAIGERGE